MTRQGRPWLYGLQSKLQLPILSLLVILIIGAGWFLNQRLEAEYRRDMEGILARATFLVEKAEILRNQNLILRFQGVSTEPRFKAIAQLGDPVTFEEMLQRQIGELSVDAVLFTSVEGKTVAFSSPKTNLDRDYFTTASADSIDRAFKFTRPSIDLVQIGNKLFNLISVPTLIGDRVIGVVTFGLEMGDKVAEEFKKLSNADVLFVANNKVLTTTFLKNIPPHHELHQVGITREILVEHEHYFISTGKFSDFILDQNFKFTLFYSSNIEWVELKSTRFKFFSFALLILFIGCFVIWTIIQNTLDNLQILSRAVEHYGSDEIFTPVAIKSNDQIGDLALIFNQTLLKLSAAKGEMVQLNSDLRSAKENAEAGNRAKSVFLTIMSHELRTPLNGILGISSIFNSQDLDKEHQEFIKIIESSGRSLLSIIDSILEFVQLESGRLVLASSRVSLTEIAQHIIKLFQEEASRKGVVLTFQDSEIAPQIFLGDPDRLRQILSILVSNAIKFTPKGSVKVTLQIGPVIGGRVSSTFRVCDTGIGMSQAVRGKLFEPFFQADATNSRSFDGAGLGLSICSRLVERMGGVIGVESAIGHGSEFYFTVPLELYLSA